jgi:hypothetical protein
MYNTNPRIDRLTTALVIKDPGLLCGSGSNPKFALMG